MAFETFFSFEVNYIRVNITFYVLEGFKNIEEHVRMIMNIHEWICSGYVPLLFKQNDKKT